jgi:hypothetical protein
MARHVLLASWERDRLASKAKRRPGGGAKNIVVSGHTLRAMSDAARTKRGNVKNWH